MVSVSDIAFLSEVVQRIHRVDEPPVYPSNSSE